VRELLTGDSERDDERQVEEELQRCGLAMLRVRIPANHRHHPVA
jgi:hypothetical protein